MTHEQLAAFAEQAHAKGIPLRDVVRRLCNMGMPYAAAQQLAEEAAAEAYGRAMLAAIVNYEHYCRWLCMTAWRWCIDQLRKRKYHEPLREELRWFNAAETFEEELGQLRGYLDRLDADERDVLRLTYVERLTLDEIAERVEVGPGTANARRLRVKRMRDVAIAKLRGYFGMK